MKKNNQSTKRKLSLEKLQISKLNNIKAIKGGIDINLDCGSKTRMSQTTKTN